MTSGRRHAGSRGRVAAAVVALALAATGAGCGNQGPNSHAGGENSGNNSADANNNGGYVDAGPITYQLQISRQLNQYSTEDSQYIKGLPAGTPNPTSTQMWYAVFLWARNQTHHDQTTTGNFVIEDTLNNRYYPLHLDHQVNPFAWTPQTLRPNETQPAPGTIASFGPTQGGLLLFKVPTSVYQDRPLTLFILSPGGKRWASISLNL